MYQMTDGMFYLEGVGDYRAYGILSPGGLRVDDITTDAARLSQFVQRLNRAQAPELQLMDFILDFIE